MTGGAIDRGAATESTGTSPTTADTDERRIGGESLPVGCHVVSLRDRAVGDRGQDPELGALKLLAAGGLLERRRLLSVLLALAVSVSAPAVRAQHTARSTPPSSWLQFAAGAGVSRFDVDPGSDIRVEDRSDLAVHVSADYRRGPWRYGVRFADLGQVRFDGNQRLGYRVLDLSVARHFGNRSWQPYLRSGIGGPFTTGDERNRIDHRLHLALGAGVEFQFSRRWGMRLDIATHNVDVVEASIGVLWRIAGEARIAAREPAELEVFKHPSPIPAESTASGSTDTDDTSGSRRADDADDDGVPTAADACDRTLPGVPVDESGCSLLDGAIEAIQFIGNTDKLSPEATAMLARVLAALILNKDMSLVVSAHVYELDTADANLLLSRRRALAVIRYFTDRGITASRLQPEAFGETRPAPGALGRRDRIELYSH